ncbi:PH domain-containing protein [Paucihalobacter sp.]|uniref:PH domain-containing protein n=1 Tax=Paucihalobacter sp. TaxID=2850405 RepID=UPI002FE2BD1B
MTNFDFSTPIRQSVKGIVIIFGFQLFKFLRQSFALFIVIGVGIVRKGSILGLSAVQLILYLLALLLFFLVFSILKYWYFKFYVSSEGFHLDKGILNKESILIPNSKIQNIHIKQNLLQQFINVVSFSIETAGDDQSEIEIKALSRPMALALKKALLSEISETFESIPESRVYYKVSAKKLLLEGIGQNHLKSLAIILAFISGIYFQFKDLFNDLEIENEFIDNIETQSAAVFSIILFNILILIVFLLLAFFFSLLKTLVVNFNLQVIEHDKTIEISKGLLNKISLNLSPSRIQKVIITNNRLKRYFGLNTLEVKQAMIDKKKAQNLSIIALDKTQLWYLVNKIYTSYSTIADQFKPTFYFVRVKAIRSVIILLILNLLVYFAEFLNLWFVNILGALIVLAFLKISYRKAFYSIDDQYLVVGSGFIETKTEIVQHHKIQSVEMRQSIFMKRRKVASVLVYTASGKISISYIEQERAKAILNYLIYRVETSGKNWM